MKIFKSTLIVGFLTSISRILGFVRDMLIAAIFGSSAIADAFFIAFKLPNLFRRILAEGAFQSAFVPLYTKELEGSGQKQANKFAADVLTALSLILLAITALAEIFMPFLLYLLSPGFADTPDKFELTINYSRITFFYICFMSLTAFVGGILNSIGRFAAFAFAPTLLNVTFIIALLLIIYMDLGLSEKSGYILSIAVIIGGLVQLLAVIYQAYKFKVMVGFTRPKFTPKLKKMLTLGIPGIIAGGIVQINIQIGTIIASLQDQAVSWLYYADRLYQLPLGVIGIALGIVLLPALSAKIGSKKIGEAVHIHNRALEFSLLLTIPCAIGLALISEPLIRLLFERAAFTADDTQATAAALSIYALGLPAFVAIKVHLPMFFANENTKTPMHFAFIATIINITLSLILFFQIKYIGIAIGTTISAIVNYFLLSYKLRSLKLHIPDKRLKSNNIKNVFCALIMSVVVFILKNSLYSWYQPDSGFIYLTSSVLIMVIAGLVTYIGCCLLFNTISLDEIKSGKITRK